MISLNGCHRAPIEPLKFLLAIREAHQSWSSWRSSLKTLTGTPSTSVTLLPGVAASTWITHPTCWSISRDLYGPTPFLRANTGDQESDESTSAYFSAPSGICGGRCNLGAADYAHSALTLERVSHADVQQAQGLVPQTPLRNGLH